MLPRPRIFGGCPVPGSSRLPAPRREIVGKSDERRVRNRDHGPLGEADRHAGRRASHAYPTRPDLT
jgi:hypothetical protein